MSAVQVIDSSDLVSVVRALVKLKFIECQILRCNITYILHYVIGDLLPDTALS